MSQIEYFLKLDGIEGESVDERHKGEIVLRSWNFGANNPMPAVPGSGAAVGKVALHDLHIVKPLDKASPRLFAACCAGDRFKSATLTARRAGKDMQEFLHIVLGSVLISSYEADGGPDPGASPEDHVSLSYARIELRYKEQKPDGTLGGEIVGGWDGTINKKV